MLEWARAFRVQQLLWYADHMAHIDPAVAGSASACGQDKLYQGMVMWNSWGGAGTQFQG
jgi:hypothetical protein